MFSHFSRRLCIALIGLFLFFPAVFILAQTPDAVTRICGTEVPGKAWNDWFNSTVEEYKKTASKEQANIIIPVIFHVIHSGQAIGTFPNITIDQLYSQIDVLNRDYSGTGFNVGNFTNTAFSPALIADCGIRFCLAKEDPAGNPLPVAGVERMNHNDYSWPAPQSYTSTADFKTFIEGIVKPATIWDASRYLNIWVSDVKTNLFLLGYSTFPPGTTLPGMPGAGTASNDGLWCWAKALGNVGTLAQNYDKGRTVTHEVGHYFGLRHIWGDAACATDYCADTPDQQKENTNCPAYPHISCSNGPTGDLFMNFMDYSLDACMYMFTNDQRTRMQAAIASSPLRKNLAVSSCNTVGIKKESWLNELVRLVPNPGNGKFQLVFEGVLPNSASMIVSNVLGKIILNEGFVELSQTHFEFDLSDQPDGIYFIKLIAGREEITRKLVLVR